MKSQKIIASCFAGVGIYLVLTSLIATVSAVTGTLWTLREMHEGWAMVMAQYAVVAVPLVVGMFFIFFARWFAKVVSSAARISDEEVALPDPAALLRVILACVGIVVLINSGSFLGQVAFHSFVLRTASAELGSEAERQIPELSQSIALILQFIAAIVLIRNGAAISAWFNRQWQRSA